MDLKRKFCLLISAILAGLFSSPENAHSSSTANSPEYYRHHFDLAFRSEVANSATVTELENAPLKLVDTKTSSGESLSIEEFKRRFHVFYEKHLANHPYPAWVLDSVTQEKTLALSPRLEIANQTPVIIWPGSDETLAMYLANMDAWAVDQYSVRPVTQFINDVLGGDTPYLTPNDVTTLYHRRGGRKDEPYTLSEIQDIQRRMVELNDGYPTSSSAHPWFSIPATSAIHKIIQANLINDLATLLSDAKLRNAILSEGIHPQTALEDTLAAIKKLKPEAQKASDDELILMLEKLDDYAQWLPAQIVIQWRDHFSDEAKIKAFEKLVRIAETGSVEFTAHEIDFFNWAADGSFQIPDPTPENVGAIRAIVDDFDGFATKVRTEGAETVRSIGKDSKDFEMRKTKTNGYTYVTAPSVDISINPNEMKAANLDVIKVLNWDTREFEVWTPLQILSNPVGANDGVTRRGPWCVVGVDIAVKRGVPCDQRPLAGDFPTLFRRDQLAGFASRIIEDIEFSERLDETVVDPALILASLILTKRAMSVQKWLQSLAVGGGLHETYHLGHSLYDFYQTGEFEPPSLYDVTIGAAESAALTAGTVGGFGLASRAFPVLGNKFVMPLLFAASTGGLAKLRGANNTETALVALKYGSLLPILRLSSAKGLVVRFGGGTRAGAVFVANNGVSFTSGLFMPGDINETRFDRGVRTVLSDLGVNSFLSTSVLFAHTNLARPSNGKPPSPSGPAQIYNFPQARQTQAIANEAVSSPAPAPQTYGALALSRSPSNLSIPITTQNAKILPMRPTVDAAAAAAMEQSIMTLAQGAISAETAVDDLAVRNSDDLDLEALKKTGIWRSFEAEVGPSDSLADFFTWLNEPDAFTQADNLKSVGIFRQHHTVKHDGSWFAFEKFGTTHFGIRPHEAIDGFPTVDKNAEALVLAFGGAGGQHSTARVWLKYATTLDKYGISVVAISHPFHTWGPNDARFFDFEYYMTWVENIVRHYKKAGKPVFLVGKSFGEGVVRDLLYRNNVEVKGAILYAPGADSTTKLLRYRRHHEDILLEEGYVDQRNIVGSDWERTICDRSPSRDQRISTNFPVIVVSSDNDYASTPEMLMEAVDYYANGRLVLIDGADHFNLLTFRTQEKAEPAAVQLMLDLVAEETGLPETHEWTKTERRLPLEMQLQHLYERSFLFRGFVNSRNRSLDFYLRSSHKTQDLFRQWEAWYRVHIHELATSEAHIRRLGKTELSVDPLLKKDPSNLTKTEIQDLETFILED